MNSSRRHCLGKLVALGSAAALSPRAFGQNVIEFDLARYEGQFVYLDFWASWCAPCMLSFPWMAQMHEKYAAQGLRIVAVNVDKTRKAADRFLTRLPAVPFELAFDPKGVLAEKYGVSGMPHSFLFDRQGKLLSDHVGFFVSESESREQALKHALSAT